MSRLSGRKRVLRDRTLRAQEVYEHIVCDGSAHRDAACGTLISETQCKRLEKRRLLGRVTSNGTVAAAVMVLAAIAAVVCANTDAYEAVHTFLTDPNAFIVLGGFTVEMSFEMFVNDFLMAVFFLLVGVELKYEMTVGELRHPRNVLLPMLAAAGGVAVPALVYVVANRAGELGGWAVPMATDIAFALGVLSLLGKRVPAGVKVFFTTLAIADDLLAIAVIALFYSEGIDIAWLAAAAAATLALAALNRRQVFSLMPYAVVGFALWCCLFESGVHATLAGVIVALAIPARSDIRADHLVDWMRSRLPDLADKYDDEAHILGQHDFTHAVAGVERVLHRVTPPLQRVEHYVSVPVNFAILPIFAFVNAQVRLVDVDMAVLLADPVVVGTYLGMVAGKPLGIVGVSYACVRAGLARLPRGVGMRHIVGVGLLGGIGFTMSILISGLAFSGDPANLLAAKAAILAATVTSAALGMAWMRRACARRP